MRPALRLLCALLPWVALGCDDAGPAQLAASVDGDAAAVLVELMGEGITGVESVGGTRALGAAGPTPGTYRVVLVAPVSGLLRFQVNVRDGSRPPPTGRVLEASDGGNQPRGVSGLTVRVEGS